MSVYEFNSADAGQARRYQEYQLEDLEEAKATREKLISEGWDPTEIPKIKFNKDEEALNRTQRRKLAKILVSGKARDLKNPEPEKRPEKDSPPEWAYSDEESDSS